MNPIAVIVVGLAWLGGMTAGALIAVGAIEMVTQRAVINLNRIEWSNAEAALLGLSRLIQGLDLGLYILLGTITTIARLVPTPGVGQPWGLFVSAPFYLIFMGALGLQVLIEWHNKKAWPFFQSRATR